MYKYSYLCQPLFNLLWKNILFIWDTIYEQVFEALKKSFTSAPIPYYFDPKLETFVETNASKYVTSGILL